ncbi:MAG TPA: hydrogen gas-evolving membrane-bound hydrogenase subunit E [Pantanalinema sp.]
MSNVLVIAIILPWLFAALLALLPKGLERWASRAALGGSLLTALSLTLAWRDLSPGAHLVTVAELDWLSVPGGRLSVAYDGLSFLFLMLTAWIAVVVVLFSGAYLPHAQHAEHGDRSESSYYALLSAFTGCMFGLLLSGHLLGFYVFWELTSLASFLLIGFWHHEARAREGALRSLGMTTAGGVMMLVGFVGLGLSVGAWGFGELLAAGRVGPHTPSLAVWAALIAAGALAKSAQVPFSSWLPGAMAAPTPVSAYLHSAALIASGIYLLARFFPLLSGTPTWHWLLIASGLVGGLLGGLIALRQDELKAMLAYSTVSQYAFIVLAFGLGTQAGAQAGLYAFFIHAFIKAGLFLLSGAVTHLTGEKRFEALGGLAHRQPVLAVLAVVLALSLGGVPIFGGFYYKEELLHAALENDAWLLLGALLAGGGLTFLYMMRFFNEIFRGDLPAPLHVERLPLRMTFAIALLAGVSLAAGLAPNWMNHALLDPAIESVLRHPAPFSVELKFSGLLLLSLVVLACVAGLWALWRRGVLPEEWLCRLPSRFAFGGKHMLGWYSAASETLLGLHDGNLRHYLRWELSAAALLTVGCWWGISWGTLPVPARFDLAVTLMLAVVLLAAAATIWLRFHVLAVIALTISGYALAVVFALMHAPDVALAQVLVETLATFSIVVALNQSRQINPQQTRILTAGRRDWGRWAISMGVGAIIGWLTYWVGGRAPHSSMGERYAADGHALSGMWDLVTAILTDFRALDTAIEILVFAAAALAVVALFRRREESHE